MALPAEGQHHGVLLQAPEQPPLPQCAHDLFPGHKSVKTLGEVTGRMRRGGQCPHEMGSTKTGPTCSQSPQRDVIVPSSAMTLSGVRPCRAPISASTGL